MTFPDDFSKPFIFKFCVQVQSGGQGGFSVKQVSVSLHRAKNMADEELLGLLNKQR